MNFIIGFSVYIPVIFLKINMSPAFISFVIFVASLSCAVDLCGGSSEHRNVYIPLAVLQQLFLYSNRSVAVPLAGVVLPNLFRQ